MKSHPLWVNTCTVFDCDIKFTMFYSFLQRVSLGIDHPEAEFNEFEPRLKSAKNRFQLSAGFNPEKFNIILSGINHI